MSWIGVDPGKKGAIARISESGAIQIERMPMVTGAKGRDEYNLTAIREILRSWADGAGCLVTTELSENRALLLLIARDDEALQGREVFG